MTPDPATPAAVFTGSEAFADLCQTLIDDEDHHWLTPIVQRSRASDWIAEIHSRPGDHEKTRRLARGQAGTMEEACQAAVDDYNEQARIARRKEELLTDPKVREALELFGVKP